MLLDDEEEEELEGETTGDVNGDVDVDEEDVGVGIVRFESDEVMSAVGSGVSYAFRTIEERT